MSSSTSVGGAIYEPLGKDVGGRGTGCIQLPMQLFVCV